MTKLNPYILRDFAKGVVRKGSIAPSLIVSNTFENSVSNSFNINYDTVIGKAQVRDGTTQIGTTDASRKNPLGLAEFVPSGSTPGVFTPTASTYGQLIAVYSATSNATLYAYDTVWTASNLTSLSNTAKNRFASLGNYVFQVNGVDAMKSSTDGTTWGTTNCITTNSVTPSLIYRAKSRLLASGDTTVLTGHSRSRIFFSSVIDPNASPPITWNTNLTTGDFIDINPDDGSNITGFSDTSGLLLVFKNNAMYRLNVITKTVDTDNIFNFGAVSQEAIVNCQGVTYFFTGQDIRRTNGGFPEQISRLGCQDFVNAISPSSWANVAAGTDGVNVTFSIGNVTLNINKDAQITYTNVVLKFSTRDESWSIHYYGTQFRNYTQTTILPTGTTSGTLGRKMIGSDTNGNVQVIDFGQTDNGSALGFLLETQDLEFGGRSHVKGISDKAIFYTQNGIDSSVYGKEEDGNYNPIIVTLNKRVNVARNINMNGRWFQFKWAGTSSGTPPIFEGFELPDIIDQGIQ